MASSPYRIVMHDGALLLFAGLWDLWQNEEGEDVHSFTIITTRPNAEMSTLHNRMPVILPNRELQNRWLQEKDLFEALTLLKPLDDDMLKIFPVSTEVNSVHANAPELYDAVEPPPTLF